MSTEPTVDFASPTAAAPAAAEPAPKAPQLNIYTVMLGLALFFVCLACLFLFLEMRTYELKIKP